MSNGRWDGTKRENGTGGEREIAKATDRIGDWGGEAVADKSEGSEEKEEREGE